MVLVLSVCVLGLAIVAYQSGRSAFVPYFGGVHPLVATVIVVLLGAACLRYLAHGGWFAVYAPGTRGKGALLAATVATVLASVMILVDLWLVLPADLNVLPPQSITFYPVMAYVAEVAFHLAPLAVLFLLAGVWGRTGAKGQTLVWSCIFLVSLIEPAFQIRPTSAALLPSATSAYVAIHVLVFNIFALWLFKRFDFVSTYVFRITYYLHWHILWGYARLHLLF